ncbi:molybdenum cofactor biosynthesis C [Fusarium heterosporum]|uniref:Molybdenum cofactor biosynthesis C n=1 Tax=Fusarium heterosporum TaxID=42747 RepID=A0A8H5TVW6_FUSHE|nr:molybdenum cofactor biosynthesis C [Fusarium heterosporum]
MGSSKHLLMMPDGRPLYQRQVEILREACPEAKIIHISLAQDSEVDGYLEDIKTAPHNINDDENNIAAIFDTETNQEEESKGPAAGLLAAFEHDPGATWLVVACDYPFITAAALQQLQSLYKPPVTCFRNIDGFCEPLLGIWSPEAISRLKSNCQQGMLSPSKVVHEMNGSMYTPPQESDDLLRNVNTKGEWENALKRLMVK